MVLGEPPHEPERDLLGHPVDPLDKARPGYCGGAVMFSNLSDVMRYCDGSLHDAGMAPGTALVMYDMRCVPFDDIQACEQPDLGRGIGINETKGSGLGLIDVNEREKVHPLAVEYNANPFDNPQEFLEKHPKLNAVELSVEDLTWFEIFFTLLSEKGNYKLHYYVSSRVRPKTSTGDASTVIVKANKSDLVANKSRFQDGLNQRPKGDRKGASAGRGFGAANAARERIKGAAPGRMSSGQLGTVRSGMNQASDTEYEARYDPTVVMNSMQFAKGIRSNAVLARVKSGHMDAVPKLEMPRQSANRSAKMEAMLKRLQTPRTARSSRLGLTQRSTDTLHTEAEEEDSEEAFRSGQNLIVPRNMNPHDARILNLENAAAELMDNNRTAQEENKIAAVESHEHFQNNLKVVQITGIREGRPVVRSEWGGPQETARLKHVPAPPSAVKKHAAAKRAAGR